MNIRWLIAACVLVGLPVAAQNLPDGFFVEEIGGEFVEPVAIDFSANDWVWVAEKRGLVWIVEDRIRRPEPFLDLRDRVNSSGERGLLGLAVDPNFAENGWVYVLYTVEPDEREPDIGRNFAMHTRLERYTASLREGRLVAQPGSRQVLLGDSPETGFVGCRPTQTAGALRFGHDGSLLVAHGDGADAGFADCGGADPTCFENYPGDGPQFDQSLDIGALRAQDLDALAGKILRLDPLTGAGMPDNPYFDGDVNSNRSKVWLYGLRNPFRFAVKPGEEPGPGTVVLGDVGWNRFEEIDVARGGENFGWPCYEAAAQSEHFNACPGRPCRRLANGRQLFEDAPANATEPTAVIPHQGVGHNDDFNFVSNALTGSAFYERGDYPRSYMGLYFQADVVHDWIIGFRFDGTDQVVETVRFASNAQLPVDLKAHPETGDLYYAAMVAPGQRGGRIRRIRYEVRNRAPIPLIAAAPINGPAPLNVTLDARESLDLDGDPMTFHWDLGDGAEAVGDLVDHRYEIGGIYTVTLTVRDDRRGVARETVNIHVGNRAPIPEILRPLPGGTYQRGEHLVIVGDAVDPEGDSVELTWRVATVGPDGRVIRRRFFTAEGPVAEFDAGGRGGEPDPVYRIILTARDDQGGLANVTVEISPTVDGDIDGDGVIDVDDVCPNIADDQRDTDGDGRGDACDPDDDNDGVLDERDNCRLTPNRGQRDLDDDGVGDACEDDADADGIPDVEDNCVHTPNPAQADRDADLLGDKCDPDLDGDGVLNEADNCLTTPNIGQADSDLDRIGDACDDDRDGDGVPNDRDNCPDAANAEQVDRDFDGVGDRCDDDRDGDGNPDGSDPCPNIPDSNDGDLDRDGLGDDCDPDDDGDGILDPDDVCPRIPNPEQADRDGDRIGDPCDSDQDGDGIENVDDNCSLVANANQADLDLDGLGDRCDDDRDGDGVANSVDNCPERPNLLQVDTDRDRDGDACDTDDDGDGLLDNVDNCPRAANPMQEDLDSDTFGDACDVDIDGDGIVDGEDNCARIFNPDQDDADADGRGDACDVEGPRGRDMGMDPGIDGGADVRPPSTDGGLPYVDVLGEGCSTGGGRSASWLLVLLLLGLRQRRRRVV